MTSTRVPATGVDVVGDPTPDLASGDCIASSRDKPQGEIGGVLTLSFGEPRLLLLPGDGVSGPAIQLVTRAGDIHVELTVGDGEVHPPHEPAVTVDVSDCDDNNCTTSA